MEKGSGLRIMLLFVFCAPFLLNGIQTKTVKASTLPAALSSALAQDDSRTQPEVRTFTGKVLSQNGERFILRDLANDTWYHLDDQQQAAKFAGKTVMVTGILDGRSDMIRVRAITEVRA